MAVIGPASSVPHYLASMQEAADRNRAHFGASPAPMVLVIGPNLPPDIFRAFVDADVLVLPWPTLASRRQEIEASIGAQIGADFPGLAPAQRATMVARLAERFMQGLLAGDGISRLEGDIIQHELGHIWFSRYFGGRNWQAGLAPGSPGGYGSAAPDWLEEMAAILTESDTMGQRRRDELARLGSQAGGSPLPPLAAYFAMTHPRAANRVGPTAPSAQAGTSGISSIRIVPTPPGERGRGSEPSPQTLFYVQSRAFADFAIERPGNRLVFRAIADHLRAGGSLQSWLSAEGARYGFPASLEALDRQWQAWLALVRTAPS